jgi:hypothetical protein
VNHISGSKAGVAGVYNRAQYLEEKIAALGEWGRYLAGLAGFLLPAPQSKTAEESDDLSNQLVGGTWE